MNSKHWIGIVGLNGSGKSTLCNILSSKGYQVISLSDVVRQHNLDQNIAIDRKHLTQQANILKKQHGLDYFAKKTFQLMAEQKIKKVVFDSVRHPAEVTFLAQQGVYFVGVKTSLKQRYHRIKSRGKATDFVDFETFKQQDKQEKLGNSYGQNIDECFKLCSEIIHNNKTVEYFHEQINKLSFLN